MKSSALFVLGSLALASATGPLFAKGLDELSEKSPEASPTADSPNADTESTAADEASEPSGEGDAASPPTVSKPLTQNVYLATSFGWGKASMKGKGSWRSGGMSDFSIGYRAFVLSEKSSLFATYRYAPLAVTSTVDGRSYRGVWESHLLGARYQLLLTPATTVSGTAELGYLKSSLQAKDGLVAAASASKSGAIVTIGGGIDRLVLEQALSIGPRVYASVGVAQVAQLALAVGFSF